MVFVMKSSLINAAECKEEKILDYILTTKALVKSYGRFKALDGLSMHVPKGAIYGFVGKNGAGKTTLLRVICGLQEAVSGEYTLYGVNGRDKEIIAARKRIGAVIETPAIYLNMSAADNLKEQSCMLGRDSSGDIQRLLKLVGLEKPERKKARNFSLGMRQRLGIAVALVRNPDFLVLDEPINGLDPQGIIEMRELLIRLNREYGITILISSHILDELSRLATHYGFIDKGKMLKEISAEDLENTCRKCICMEVSDTDARARVLDDMKVKYKVLSPSRADVYEKVNISRLVTSLLRLGCEVISMEEHDENLESYFVDLVGGADHE